MFRKVVVRDTDLLRWVALAVAAVLVYLAIWAGVAPPQPTTQTVDHSAWTVCQSDDARTSFPFAPVLLIAELVSLGFGVYLCIATRALPSLFNETKVRLSFATSD